MEYVIYGDVLVAVNFIIDLLIPRLCQPLTGIRQRGLRPYLAAAAGGEMRRKLRQEHLEPLSCIVPGRLVVRESTGAAANR